MNFKHDVQSKLVQCKVNEFNMSQQWVKIKISTHIKSEINEVKCKEEIRNSMDSVGKEKAFLLAVAEKVR